MGSSTRSQSRPSAETAPPAAPSAQPDSRPQPNGQSEKRQPVFTWSHATGSGRVEIAVWDKAVSTDNGEKVLYHVTCQRSYRKQEGGYENTGIFWHTDLLVLAHGMEVVFDRIKEMQQNAYRDAQENVPY